MVKPEDQAQEIELAEWEERQKQAIQPKPIRESATYCRDSHCGAPIPEKRRRAVPGVEYCAECQERIERLKTRKRA